MKSAYCKMVFIQLYNVTYKANPSPFGRKLAWLEALETIKLPPHFLWTQVANMSLRTQVKAAFEEIDTEKTGKLSVGQLAALLKKLNPDFSDDDIKLVMSKLPNFYYQSLY